MAHGHLLVHGQTSNFDQFKAIDGVMGFTGGGSKNVFHQLVQAGACDNVYAICMHQGSKSNGTLTVGGVDPRLSENVSYVPDSGEGAFRAVHVGSFAFGGSPSSPAGYRASAPVPVGKTAILDTGTNILLVPGDLLGPMQAAMCGSGDALAHCSDLWAGKCFPLTASQVAAYPDLSINLSNGVQLVMGPGDYLLLGSPLAGDPSNFCLGIKDGGSAGGGFIIGDTTMRNYYLVFDLAESRIGWGPVNKANCGSI